MLWTTIKAVRGAIPSVPKAVIRAHVDETSGYCGRLFAWPSPRRQIVASKSRLRDICTNRQASVPDARQRRVSKKQLLAEFRIPPLAGNGRALARVRRPRLWGTRGRVA